jgi:hypothetical protein
MLLIPYAYTDDLYNTGIAIANTTSDPGLEAMGFEDGMEVFPQDGAVTFYFYRQDGEVFQYTTMPGSPGAGLDADGKVMSGGMYTVLIGIVWVIEETRLFSGYIVKMNFTNAHGNTLSAT